MTSLENQFESYYTIVFIFLLLFINPIDVSDRFANWWSSSPSLPNRTQDLRRYHYYDPNNSREIGVKYVTWSTDSSFGFNNQRQVFTLAVIIAHLLNRTLLLRQYEISFHDDNATSKDIHQYFDINAIKDCIAVETDVGTTMQKKADGIFFPHVNPNEVLLVTRFVKKYRFSKHPVLRFSFTWAHIRNLLRFPSATQEKFYDDIQRNCVRYNQLLHNRAIELVKTLGNRYHAIHFRLKDFAAYPLVNCTAINLANAKEFFTCWVPTSSSSSSLSSQKVSNKKSKGESKNIIYKAALYQKRFYTMLDAVGDSPEVMKDDLIFIATNAANDKRIQEFRKFAASRSLKVLLFSDVCALSSACYNSWGNILTKLEVSIIEQIIAVYSNKFFATFPSSWSEFVLTARRWLGIDPLAPMLEKLFFKKALLHLNAVHKKRKEFKRKR